MINTKKLHQNQNVQSRYKKSNHLLKLTQPSLLAYTFDNKRNKAFSLYKQEHAQNHLEKDIIRLHETVMHSYSDTLSLLH